MNSKNKKRTSVNSFFSSKYNKVASLIVGFALVFTIAVVVFFSVGGDLLFKKRDVGTDASSTTIIYKDAFITYANKENDYFDDEADDKTKSDSVTAAVNGNKVPVQNTPSTPNLEDPSGWSQGKILEKAKNAVNKTKQYKGSVTVSHSESFTADVTECTGGEIVKGVANIMIGWIVKPVDETLTYNNGKAVNSEGETIPLLLPLKNNFLLTQSGVKSAKAYKTGSEYVIKISLVEERVGINDVPTHNAASIGYLDVKNFDLSILTIDSADIVYKGSSLELHINADGFVTYAKYSIPLNVSGAGHSGSISGTAVFDGEQTEIWNFNW